ncbi:HD domain-containing protein [Brevibacillus fluminis]|uniref:HD domain-containing protein n=1 Tax=Brevibacillus fluminis TaxID=511487 RepID=UPI003F88F949
MDKDHILTEAENFVKDILKNDSSGHDWWHIYRVSRTAKTIAAMEQADSFVCELAALLHDVADEKISQSEEIGLALVKSWLADQQVPPETAAHIVEIISTMSFKGGNRPSMRTLEGKIVQDADRLDAIGAIGIARVFAYSGAKGRAMHDPALPVREQMTQEEYRSGNDTAINHFYEKLLKLKDLMNTDYGKQLAWERHAFMLAYLDHFYAEWEGESSIR